MKCNYLKIMICTALFFMGSMQTFAQCPSIVWSDEFNGTSLDQSKWNYQIGDGCAESICGWGNNELQSYQQDNVSVENGRLKITALKERVKGSQYTSGRINTKGKADFTYGRYEARVKLPYGDGLWPAFWMLSTNEAYGGWPQSGEIDIMEFTASNPDNAYGTIHYGDLYPNNQYQGNDFDLVGANFPDDFHEFAIEWEAGEIRWFIDDILYSIKTVADVSPYNWPFDQDFHFLLNVAVGGNLGGPVNNNMLPATMEVDYVRVLDGFKPYIAGKRIVLNQANAETISIGNIANNAQVNWTVPTGATIVSGQGSNEITIDYGNSSGIVSATYDDGCASKTLSLYVNVEPPFSKALSFENFDAPASITFASSTGTFNEVNNPAPNTINNSALVGEYTRDGASQYDLLIYSTSNLTDASAYVNKDKKFYMDVYTDAPIGTTIILQLETADATANNYPTGRHSRFEATVEDNGQWQRLIFSLLDRPDPSAADADVNQLILLFASNTSTSDLYYFDNFDSYVAGSAPTPNTPPSVSIDNPTDASSFVAGSNLAIAASASDSDGTVQSVSFYADGNLIGTDVSSPYTMSYVVPLGSTSLTASALDNDGASATSSAVVINGTSSGAATDALVSGISTSTASAGRGSNYGTAQVSIQNNLGQAVSGATVSATFSGTFNQTVSGTTNSQGVVSFQTTNSDKGGLTVILCVDNVTASGLNYDPANNLVNCSNDAAARSSGSIVLNTKNSLSNDEVRLFPNPTAGSIHLVLPEGVSDASIAIYNMQGALMIKQVLSNGTSEVKTEKLPIGLYLIVVKSDNYLPYQTKLMKK